MSNRIPQSVKNAIRAHIDVPEYIMSCAHIVAYDIMHGPAFVTVPEGKPENITQDCLATLYEDAADECVSPADTVEQAYAFCGPILREWIDNNLPAELWIDTDSDCVRETSPDEGGYDDDSGDWIEFDNSAWWHVESRDIIQAIFGRTIAREFY